MSNRLLSTQPWAPHFAALLLRLIVGGLFIYHGYSKIEMYDQYAAGMEDILRIGAKNTYIVIILAELGCGILVTLGLFTRLAIIPIFITMIVAFFHAHKNDPFMMKELPFVFMLLCLPVFILGSGKYSVDRLIFKS